MSKIGLISENDNSTVLAEYEPLNKVATSYQSEDALEKELIKTLVEQGYERLNINSEDELILNLKRWDTYLHPNRCQKDTPTKWPIRYRTLCLTNCWHSTPVRK